MIVGYTEFLTKIEVKEGPKQAIAYAKACWTIALAISTNGKWEPIPFRKATKEGVPAALRPLLPLLRGGDYEKRWALTVISTYKAYRLPASMDTQAITNPGPDLREVFDMSDFSLFVRK